MGIAKEWADRFNEKWSADENGCWIWKGAATPKGYGIIKIPGERKQEYAHRLSFRIYVGEIPDGSYVLHRCDVPPCVNWRHLFLGDAKANSQDMKAKNRHLCGELNTEAVLTVAGVRRIKALLETGEFAQWEIASMLGVSQITVSRIKRGLRWGHVK